MAETTRTDTRDMSIDNTLEDTTLYTPSDLAARVAGRLANLHLAICDNCALRAQDTSEITEPIDPE